MKKLLLSGSIAVGLIVLALSAQALPTSFGISKGWPMGPGNVFVTPPVPPVSGSVTNGLIDGSTSEGTSLYILLK